MAAARSAAAVAAPGVHPAYTGREGVHAPRVENPNRAAMDSYMSLRGHAASRGGSASGICAATDASAAPTSLPSTFAASTLAAPRTARSACASFVEAIVAAPAPAVVESAVEAPAVRTPTTVAREAVRALADAASSVAESRTVSAGVETEDASSAFAVRGRLEVQALHAAGSTSGSAPRMREATTTLPETIRSEGRRTDPSGAPRSRVVMCSQRPR